jgi:monoterpene epsilon-lactone hydrolase
MRRIPLASEELQVVLGMLRANPPISGGDIQEMRAGMDALTANAPLPEDVHFEAIDAGGVPAEWTVAEGADPERAIVYFHGGGYVIGSIQSHRGLCAALSRASGARVLSTGYRLGPEHPHPAAVEDGIAAARFVREQGIAPERTAIAGDSAGGGLTAATLIALRDAGDPLPAAGVCISPWLDLTLSGDTMKTKAEVDPMVQKDVLQPMVDAYIGRGDPKAPTASPLFAELTGLPPLLIQVGSAETLLDDSLRFRERAAGAGIDVSLEVWDEMIHVWHAFEALLPEARQAIERIGEYLKVRVK